MRAEIMLCGSESNRGRRLPRFDTPVVNDAALIHKAGMISRTRSISVILVSVLLSGVAQSAHAQAVSVRVLEVCHGYGCAFRSKLSPTSANTASFVTIMAKGRASPAAERAAVAKAVQHYETLALKVTGVRDDAKSKFAASRIHGQMDCIDESGNTRGLLLYLQARGLLRHHSVAANTSRGFLLDGRYPHWTAVLRERSGANWSVDSWVEPMGGRPEIVPLQDWKSKRLSNG
ncbi:hypothetical protein QBK99_06625 [Corticibacterium sp. UT-5YL-CI-8]|nr:hypothetical protein [Tianweitania sp. UT-5YL-CI-8]